MNNSTKNIVTRFPPSPTGLLHVGSLRTALFNFYFAKKNNGEMKFRLEDTNREKWKQEYEDNIIQSMDFFLGIKIENPIRQSDRVEVYKKYILKLIESGKAYISNEAPKEAGERSQVIRFKNPNIKFKFNDLILGDIENDTTDLGDFVIAKDLDHALYHLTVVVDDFEMGITHVIRGQDHITNTPRQILIQEALGAPRPFYAHIPLILAPDKTKLSKRHGATAVSDYLFQGFLPEALVNFLSLIGWNPGDEREILSLEELINEFTLEKVHKNGAVFDVQKLTWMNKEYIKLLDNDKLLKYVLKFLPISIKNLPGFSTEMLVRLLPIIRDRIAIFSDIDDMAISGDLDYFFKKPKYEKSLLKTTEFIPELLSMIENLNDNDFTAELIKTRIWDFATEKGRGNVLWPMRVALSGAVKSPDPFTLAAILGKYETMERLKFAVNK
ncbi:MAG: glutamate--tRNA ligase [Candidatus Vogelbacteria bacterium]|nr:glutamate--tRNA ligase [Candidatus Vogelbacteria bacterium]